MSGQQDTKLTYGTYGHPSVGDSNDLDIEPILSEWAEWKINQNDKNKKDKMYGQCQIIHEKEFV